MRTNLALLLLLAVACDSEPEANDTGNDVDAGHDAGADAGETPALSNAIECATEDAVGGTCKAQTEGVFAIKIELDAWWKDNGTAPLGFQLIRPGRDKIVVYLRGEISETCDDGSDGRGRMQVCGTEVPAFRSDFDCSTFQLEFPETIWESESVPTFITKGRTSGFEPGDLLTLDARTGLFGIDLVDPDGEWPSYQETTSFTCTDGASGDACFPDHDGDGNPGVTVRLGRIGETDVDAGPCADGDKPFVFRGAALGLTPTALVDGAPRAGEVAIGLRMKLGGAGAISEDCESGVGDSVAGMLDSRTYACWLDDGSECTPAAATFIDSVTPVWNILAKGEAPPSDVLQPEVAGGGPIDQTPSKGPRSALVRLGDLGESFSCEDVRNADFAPL